MSLDMYEILEIPDTSERGLQDLFQEKGWGDGLPMIAPTRDRVEEMLSASQDLAVSYTHLTLPTTVIV